MVSNHQHVTLKIYVEGGGDQNRLKRECRHAFGAFFEKVGFRGRMPRVIGCGSRNKAYDDFCTSLKGAQRTGELAFLLVDSEDDVRPAFEDIPWEHLKIRDNWVRPNGASNEQVHLMIQCMESWFLADLETLSRFFGQGFNSNSLSGNIQIESITKADVFRSLENASRHSQKGSYGKGAHSFKILEIINAEKVIAASPSARRLIHELDKVL